MVKKTLILTVVFVLCSTALADRSLSRSEILEIFTSLNEIPVKSWIQSCTLKATHEKFRAAVTTDINEIDTRIDEEVQAYQDDPNKTQPTDELQEMMLEAIPFNVLYELSNEYTMNSTVVLKYDGDKFNWKINIDSRKDSVQKPAELAENYLTSEFDMYGNQERIFAWDGQQYVTYFKPVNHAMIDDEPSGVNGPLTAGVIPWGYGKYTLANLSSAPDLTGLETEVDGQIEIQLIVVRQDGIQETFKLDPAKNYALNLYSAIFPNNTSVLHLYDDYQLVAGKWCPGSIMIKKYDLTQTPYKQIARDFWDYTSISPLTPSPDDFEVSYEFDAYIEDFTFGDEPLRYRYDGTAKNVDTYELLQQKLEFASLKGKQNCATASLKYTCDKLGVKCSGQDLSLLVHGQKKTTTLAQMRQFAQSLGLNAVAVKTDIKQIKNLDDYQVIVHLPGQKHFVVLSEIDDKYVRLIDLAENTFYYRRSIEYFNSVWDGTALLVSKKPVAVKSSLVKLDNHSLKAITGSCEDCNSSCNSSSDTGCVKVSGNCGSRTITYSRTCCGSAPSGDCSESSFIFEKTQNCEEDVDTSDCAGEGNWQSSTGQACG